MACTACHEAWPKLNAQGWAFRDNGYQWLAGKDNPITLNPAYWPIAVRTTVGYQYQSLTNQPSNGGNIAVNTGRIGTSGIDLLFAGTLTNNVSFLLVIEPQLTNVGFTTGIMTDPALITAPGEVGLVESLWVRFDNIFGSPYLNFKIGRGSLDVAFDEHRSFFIFNNSYALYHYHAGLGGNTNPFEQGSNIFQASIEGHNVGSSFRYALTLMQTQDDPGSAMALSAPGFYGHVQGTLFPAHKGLAEVRGGVFGAVGSYPTMQKYNGVAPDGTSPPSGPVDGTNTYGIPGTGFENKMFYREGIDLSFWFDSLATPLNLRLLGVVGQDDKAFIANGQQDAIWAGMLAELDWTPMLNFTAALRFDFVANLQQADNISVTPQATGACGSGALATNCLYANDSGNIYEEGLVLRYQLDIIPRTGTALDLEADYITTVGTGSVTDAAGAYTAVNQNQFILFAGLDFAF
jgi:hypothetical protein